VILIILLPSIVILSKKFNISIALVYSH